MKHVLFKDPLVRGGLYEARASLEPHKGRVGGLRARRERRENQSSVCSGEHKGRQRRRWRRVEIVDLLNKEAARERSAQSS